MRSSTSTASSSNIVGTAWVGIEGEVVEGPAAGIGNSFTWWKVAWDSNPTAWSAEGSSRLIVISRPGTFSLTSPTVGQSFTLPSKPTQLDWGNSSDATEYEVRLERGDSTPDTVVDTVGSSNWTIDVNLTAGTWYWQVEAKNSAGERDMSQTGRFVIVAPTEPEITEVTPDPVPPSTNVTITVRGSDFTATTTLEFRDPDGDVFPSQAAKLDFVSSTRIDYEMNNDNDSGAWEVRALTPGASPSDWFDFMVGVVPSDPEITGVAPDPVPPSTSVLITVTGNDFTDNTTLEFRDPDGATFPSQAAKLDFVSSTRIDYEMNNDNDSGPWEVRALTPGASPSDWFDLAVGVIPSDPEITGVTPDPVPPSTSVMITVTGNDFTDNTTLEFRDPDGATFPSVAAKLDFVSNTRIDYEMNNDNDSGPWEVRALTPGASPSDWFDFTVGVIPSDPEITGVAPDPVPPSTSVMITVSGTNFTDNTTLEFRDPDGATFPSVVAKLDFVLSTRIDYDMNNDNDSGGWQVRAHTPGASPSDWFDFTVGVGTIPTKPTILSPGTSSAPGSNLPNLTPTFTWEPVTGASRYSIAVSKHPYGAGNTVYTSDYRYGESFPIPAGYLQPATLYRWQLGAINSAGQEGPPSDILYFQTPASGPLSIQVTDPTSASTWYAGETRSITWGTTGNTQDIAYCRVYFSLNGGTGFSQILPDQSAGSASMNWQIPSNFSSSQAKIKVVAFNAVGASIFSVTTPNFSIQLPGLKPTSRPDANNSGPSPGTTVTFTGTASTAPAGRTITSYEWNFGDGTTKSGATVTHSYTSGGSFSARLTVTDSAGQTDSRSLAIYVSGKNLGVENESSKFADPVNLATGNFILDAKDLEIPGMGFPLTFSRFYNSKASAGNGLPIGQNWTHSYNIALSEEGDGSVVIRFGDGRQETHTTAIGGGYTSESGVHDVLEKPSADTYVLRTKDQIFYTFVAGRLESVSDRNNNTQDLEYDVQGRLERVLDTSGRFFEFTYNAQGRIAELTDPLDRTVQYGYDADGNLTSVTNPLGGVTAYTYDALHQLLTARDPNGNIFVTNEYDAQQRVVSYQRDALGNKTDFHYDFVSGLTTVTDPFGNVTKHLHDERLRLVAKTDELGHTESYKYDDNNNRTAVVSKNGHATRYTYDSAGNVTSKIDPHGSRTIIEYNSRNDPVFRMDAIGHAARLAGSETDGYGTSFDYDVRGNLFQSTDAKGHATVMTFNSAGKILTLTDRRGNVTTHDYDPAGNRMRTTNALAGETSATFDPVGRILTSVNQNGHTTHFTYDPSDHVLTVLNPLNHTTTHEYDANGNRTLTRDPLGGETRFEYDAKDRLTKITDAMGGIVRHEYDAYDRKTKTIDPLGNATLFGYDAAGRMTSTTDPLGNVTGFGYDPNGNRTGITDPLGKTSHFAFDELDHLITTTDALGNTTAYEYDRLGRRTKVTDALGRETRSEFDPLGKLEKVTDAAGGTVLYTYDEEGNRISMTNPLGKTTLSTYDALNRLIRRQEPAGSTEQYSLDAVGNRIQRIDAKNQTVGYVYDEANRLVRINYPVGLPVIFTYDAKGNRLSMQDSVGTSTYVYDALNRMTSYSNPFSHTVGYEYDANSNRKALIYPGNKRVDYTYDTANRMLSVKDWGNRTTTYQYDAAGRLLSSLNPNGTSSTQTFDDAGRLGTLSNRQTGGGVISEYAYTLDAVGNHLQVQQQEPIDATPNLGAFNYSYDDEDRIQDMEGLAQSHDANGNLTGSGPDVLLTYDFENRLIIYQSGADEWKWRYDGTGKRVELDWGDAPQRFVLDVNTPLTQVIGIADEGGGLFEYYIYGLGLVSKIDSPGNASFYHYDSRGSTIAMTDQAGQVVANFAYDPFGRLLGRQPSNVIDRFTFLGRHGVMNDYNGFHFVRARHYSVRRGRFLSKDPFLGSDDQSQTLNRYVYALNNPVRLIDISGFSARESSSTAIHNGTTDRRHALLLDIQRNNLDLLKIERSNIRLEAAINIFQGFEDAGKTARSFVVEMARGNPTGALIGVAGGLLNQLSTLSSITGSPEWATYGLETASNTLGLYGGLSGRNPSLLSAGGSLLDQGASAADAAGYSGLSKGLDVSSKVLGFAGAVSGSDGGAGMFFDGATILTTPFEIYSSFVR